VKLYDGEQRHDEKTALNQLNQEPEEEGIDEAEGCEAEKLRKTARTKTEGFEAEKLKKMVRKWVF